MTFSLNGWNRITSSANEKSLVLYAYKLSTDTLATIKGSGYFNDLMQDLTNGVGVLKIGDAIFIQGSDGSDLVLVTAVTTAVTVGEFGNLDVADASITTAKLATNAVTTVKITDANVTTAKILDANITTAKILDANVTTAKIADANVTLAKLAAGITPSHVVKFAGEHTTVGGAAAEAITVAGVLATDLVLVQLETLGGTPRTILIAVATTDTITVTFSGDPSSDHVVTYLVLRAAA